jgi:hypothetical protein
LGYYYVVILTKVSKGQQVSKSRFSIFISLLIFSLFLLSCSTPSWFPIKKGPPHKAKTKELLNREVVIIDGEEYVKVLNPEVSQKGEQAKYLYVPVNEYLSKRETYVVSSVRKEEPGRDPTSPKDPLISLKPGEVFAVSSSLSSLSSPELKKKVVIAHIEDRTTQLDEKLGDWVTEKLIKELNRKSDRILCVDYPMIKEFLEKRAMPLSDLENPEVLQLLNEVFGIHAVVLGHLSGPYVFMSKSPKDPEGIATAVIRIEVRLLETFTAKTMKTFSVNNPVFAAKERGTFSEEKAKVRAIDVTVTDLSKSLSKEIEGLDWFCRVAKVEGDAVYLNAGKMTGLRLGDVMEVVRTGGLKERGEVKGEIQISAFFGIDASVGKLIHGRKPEANDILKLARSEGT